MSVPSAVMARNPVSPTTPAMAPNAPTGAAHMIIMRILKTRRCTCPTPVRIGVPAAPIDCSPNPTSSATNRVCRIDSPVSEARSVVGMMPTRKSVMDSPPPSTS